VYKERSEYVKAVVRENVSKEDIIHVLMIRFGFTYKQAENFYNLNGLLNEPGQVKETDYSDKD
jgi:hypothetical protein